MSWSKDLSWQENAVRNIKLAHHATWKLKDTWPGTLEDLRSTMFEGLCKAAKTYDPRKGEFSTYAMTVMTRLFLMEKKKIMLRSKMEIPLSSLQVEDNDRYIERVFSSPGEIDEVEEKLKIPKKIMDIIMKSTTTPTRAKILDAVLRGKITSIREISRRVGCSPMTIYNYFKELSKRLKEAGYDGRDI